MFSETDALDYPITTYKVKPFLLQFVNDDLKYFVRDFVELVVLAFGVDSIKPFLVYDSCVSKRTFSYEGKEPCSSMSYST